MTDILSSVSDPAVVAALAQQSGRLTPSGSGSPFDALIAALKASGYVIPFKGSPALEALISEKEAARTLGLAQQTLVDGRFRGKPVCPYVRLNRRVLYRPSDIRTLIESNLHGARAA